MTPENPDLVCTLKALRTDSSRVVDLYRQLYDGTFVVAVQAGSEADVRTALFLYYPSPDSVNELPVFTSYDFIFENIHSDAVYMTVSGTILWPCLLDVVRTGQCVVAVDPSQDHGIRLDEGLILGMIRSYEGS